jgi:hypothetical protein
VDRAELDRARCRQPSLRAVAGRSRELGAERLEWEAEPNARGFYERMGGTCVRDGDVTEWGRVLEVLGVRP